MCALTVESCPVCMPYVGGIKDIGVLSLILLPAAVCGHSGSISAGGEVVGSLPGAQLGSVEGASVSGIQGLCCITWGADWVA